MPETWVDLLREFSSTDLQRGWEGVIKGDSDYPPTAKQFRDLCLKNAGSHAKNHQAYIDFKDPNHPSYEPPRIESDAMKSVRENTARTALAQMKGMF